MTENVKPTVKKRNITSVKFTKYELIHLRDVMSIMLPPNGDKTVSQVLAEVEGRQVVESVLWKKISRACRELDVPLDDEAPDYVVATVGQPQMSVFQVSVDVGEEE